MLKDQSVRSSFDNIETYMKIILTIIERDSFANKYDSVEPSNTETNKISSRKN